MRRLIWGVVFLAAGAVGCSPDARERVKHFFFEVPEGASAGKTATDSEPAEDDAQLATVRLPETRFVSVHPPVRGRNCAACHDEGSRMAVRDDFMDACAECHPRYFDEDLVMHEPVASGECAECHLPHRSEYGSLLIRNAAETCAECHDVDDLDDDAHDVPNVATCTACHDPHFGENALLKPDYQPASDDGGKDEADDDGDDDGGDDGEEAESDE